MCSQAITKSYYNIDEKVEIKNIKGVIFYEENTEQGRVKNLSCVVKKSTD